MTVTRVLGVPIDSVGADTSTSDPFGTEKMPQALRESGLTQVLTDRGVPDGGDLAVRVVGSSRDATTGLVGWPSADAVTRTIRHAVANQTRAGERLLLLGGCCALLPGAVAGLRDALGSVSVVNIDGHMDLYDETTSPTGEIADVPIAALLGFGADALQPALALPESQSAVLNVEDVALVGYRDTDEAARYGSVMPADIRLDGTWDVHDVRADAAAVAQQVLNHVSKPYWVHLDLDVLDEQVLPATDYLMPGGLDFAELASLLRPIVQHENFAGMSVACLNPEKDARGQNARDVTDLLAETAISE